MPIPPAKGLLPALPGLETVAADPAPIQASADKKLTIEDLYTPLEQEAHDEEAAPLVTASTIIDALNELRAELGIPPKDAPGAAARDWGTARDAAVINPSTASWQGPGPVSARPKPLSSFGGSSAARAGTTDAPARSMLPSEALWPLPGEQGTVTSRFGWEDDSASGTRRWNSGVWIAAAPDTPVRAVLPGTVVYAGPRDGRGHSVVLEHQDGYRSYYSNLEPNPLQIGEHVRHGAEFARIAVQPSPTVNGENSASLHFELKKGEMALNPESALGRT